MFQTNEKPQILRTVSALLDQDFANAQDLKLPGWPKNHQKLYPSQLPYCGLRHLYERLTEEESINTDTFTNQMFSNIGQGMHWAYQRFLGSLGNAIANWYCTGPIDDPHDEVVCELKTYRKCSTCGRPMRHRELKMSDGVITGKTDFLWVARTGENAWGNLLFPLDIKSTDDDRIAAQVDDPSLTHYPNRDHVSQMEAYVPMVEKEMGRKVAGWILHYIGRGKPFKNQLRIIHLINEGDRVAYQERNQFYNDHHRMSMDVFDGSGAMNPPNIGALDKLIETKPCATAREYEQNFHTFHSPCPLRESCFNRQRLDKVLLPLLPKIQ